MSDFEYFCLENNVPYKYTNENIFSIFFALSITKKDNVLSICSSLDQAIPMIDIGAKVTAFDRNKSQISYAEWRLENLKLGKIENFLCVNPDSDRNTLERNCFFREVRLEQLRLKMKNLTLVNSDFTNFTDKGFLFNKVYLSNAIGYSEENKKLSSKDEWNSFFHSFSSGTLFYVCLEDGNKFNDFVDSGPFFNRKFRKDKGRTKVARKRESRWSPEVWEKV